MVINISLKSMNSKIPMHLATSGNNAEFVAFWYSCTFFYCTCFKFLNTPTCIKWISVSSEDAGIEKKLFISFDDSSHFQH